VGVACGDCVMAKREKQSESLVSVTPHEGRSKNEIMHVVKRKNLLFFFFFIRLSGG
jgi:hypothetical protein